MRGKGSEGLGARNPVWFDLVQIYASKSIYSKPNKHNNIVILMVADSDIDSTITQQKNALKMNHFNQVSVDK